MLAFLTLLKQQIESALCANADATRRLLASLPSDMQRRNPANHKT